MDQEHPKELSPDEINEMEEKRISLLNESGIDEQSVLESARDDTTIWQNYFDENMTRGKSDLNFAIRDQWTAPERSEFTRLEKLCWTANKLLDPVNKIVGEQRKNKPDLQARSLTGKATQEQINLRADLVRTISYQSQNDLIYQMAFRQSLLMGWSGLHLDVDYESPMSFNKIIKFIPVTDPMLIAFDPVSTKPHKGDGDFCSRQYLLNQDQFSATYPYILNPVSYSDPRTLIDFQWLSKETIVICDYFKKEWFPLKIFKLSNGESVTESEWEEIQKNEIKIKKELAASAHSLEARQLILETIPSIVSERQTQDYEIMHYRLIKDQIIEFTKWPSKYLPIIFVDGNSHFIEGRQHTRSYIHSARDVQKYHNFLLSERATDIKNRRREQWMGTPDNILGNEQQWRNPETQVGILEAKPDPKTGQMPIKLPAWQLSGELIEESQSSDQEIREILGYSESQELQGRDVSGKARRERKIEGSMAAYVYRDNLDQAIEQCGRVILDLLPYVYGEDERHVILSKKDGKTQSIVLNKNLPDGSVDNKIDKGDYDIEISTGPSFSVQKDMALEFFQQTLQANPQVFPLIADLWAKNLDIQYMEQIVERFKTLVPPKILAKEEGKELPPQPPSPQEQAMQMEMQLKQAELKEKEDELQLRAEQHQLDRERYQLEKMKMMMEMKKVNSEIGLNMHDKKIDMHKADLDYSAKIAKIMADLHNK